MIYQYINTTGRSVYPLLSSSPLNTSIEGFESRIKTVPSEKETENPCQVESSQRIFLSSSNRNPSLMQETNLQNYLSDSYNVI